jgi:hypothetical protein
MKSGSTWSDGEGGPQFILNFDAESVQINTVSGKHPKTTVQTPAEHLGKVYPLPL